MVVAPKRVTKGVRSLREYGKIRGSEGDIISQFIVAPPRIAEIARLIEGVENEGLLLLMLDIGIDIVGEINLAIVIRIEYAAVRNVAKNIIENIRRLWLKNVLDSRIRSLE